MRVDPPSVAVTGDEVALSARFVSEAGAFPDTTVELAAPRALVGRVDSSATPFVPVAAVVGAVVGEDVTFGGAVVPSVLAGATAAIEAMAGWWGWSVPALEAPATGARPDDPDRGHGLFFTRGLDSWASLLALADQPEAPTHLLTVSGIDRPRSDAEHAVILAATRRVAAERGLPLLELSTDVRRLLDPLDDWTRTHGAVLAGLALLLAPRLSRVSIAASYVAGIGPPWGSHPELDHLWGGDAVRIVHHLDGLDRVAKAALVGADDGARASLLVCWEGGRARNCGTCAKCLRTMTALHLVGALDACPTFDAPLTAEAVRRASPPDMPVFVAELLDRVDPEDDLAQAWRTHLPGRAASPGPVAPDTRAVAGPSLRARVDAAVAAGPPPPDTEAADRSPLVMGWEAGQVPLRPARRRQHEAGRAVAGNAGRPYPWVLAELADPLGTGEAGPSAVAERAEALWGPGLCYLAGVAWAVEAGPVLSTAAVARLLRSARLRCWWQSDGTLDPLRVVESIEHGCLPVQVMPVDRAAALRPRLPRSLAPLVVDLDSLAGVGGNAVGPLLAEAAALVLAGWSERDLARAAGA